MKNQQLIAATLLFLATTGLGQEKYQFTIQSSCETTSIKNQQQTGTCWSFSSSSFLESEYFRKFQKTIDLSEMYVVRENYVLKADNYIRRQGKANFDEGGLAHDYIANISQLGLMPESAYKGREADSIPFSSGEMLKVLQAMMPVYAEAGAGKVSANYHKAVNAILDTYMGPLAPQFQYEGKNYTPQSFAKEVVKLDPSEYISITSFTHHPFYQPFILEVPDNWSNGSFYNVPLNNLSEIAKQALQSGFTLCWDADVSEKEFLAKKGIAIVPVKSWTVKTDEEKNNTGVFTEAEKTITQDMRQEGFDNQSTTDDHLMHIVGLAKDAAGKTWFVVKNSWGDKIGREEKPGYVYVSEAYFNLKTIAITLNKAALPNNVKKQLGI